MSGGDSVLGNTVHRKLVMDPLRLRRADDSEEASVSVELWAAACARPTLARRTVVSRQPDGWANNSRDFPPQAPDFQDYSGLKVRLPEPTACRRWRFPDGGTGDVGALGQRSVAPYPSLSSRRSANPARTPTPSTAAAMLAVSRVLESWLAADSIAAEVRAFGAISPAPGPGPLP
jgi:hypothetical protein